MKKKQKRGKEKFISGGEFPLQNKPNPFLIMIKSFFPKKNKWD